MNSNLLLPFLILFPMLGGAASFVVGRCDKRWRDLTASGVTLIELGAAAYGCTLLGAKFSLPGVCGLGLNFRLDGFRLIYAVVIAYMWAATTIFSGEYLEHHRNRNRYYLFVLLTLGSIMGVFLSADLYTTFVFFELMSLFSLVMVIQDETRAALTAAQTYLAIAIIGGLMTLTGLILFYAQTGTLEISALASVKDRPSLYLSGGLIFSGFAAKAAIFPAHIWLPTAHTAAPAPSSALLSGLLTKSGLFGVLVLTAGPFLHDPRWGLALLLLALVTMSLGAVLALFSVNIKRTLACSSMSQLGFILSGIAMQCFLGSNNDLAVRGAILYMVGHSLIKLVLFLAAGVVHMNTHRLELNEIRGFGRGRPLFLFVFLMGGLGLMGMPLWNGYLGKTLVHEAIVEHIYHLAGAGTLSFLSLESELALFRFSEWVFLISGGMTAAYVAKLFVMLFVAEPAPGLHVKERYISPINAVVLGLSAAVLPLLGSLPYHLADPIAFLGAPFMNGPAEHHAVGYFLLESLQGAGISLGLGALIYVFFIRALLMRTSPDGLICLDLWPAWLNLEWGLFRPLLRGLALMGALLAKTVDRVSSALLSVFPFLGALLARVLDVVLAGPVTSILSRAARVRFVRVPEDTDFGIYGRETPSLQALLPSSLAYSLMTFAMGALCILAWLAL